MIMYITHLCVLIEDALTLFVPQYFKIANFHLNSCKSNKMSLALLSHNNY